MDNKKLLMLAVAGVGIYFLAKKMNLSLFSNVQAAVTAPAPEQLYITAGEPYSETNEGNSDMPYPYQTPGIIDNERLDLYFAGMC